MRYVKEFTQQMYQQLGMRVFVLSAHMDTEKNICISQQVFAVYL
jgi:hypothetical protein